MKKKVKLNNIKFSSGLILVILLFFIVIIVRISYLSLSKEVDGINLQEFASQRTGKKETLKAKRGTIYDVNGNVLAENVSSYTLIAYLDPIRSKDSKTPQHVVDKEDTAKKLSKILGMDKKKILNYLNKKIYQTEFGTKGKGLTELVKDEIVALNLPGLDFIETQKRHYPYGNFLSYTIGYARNKNSEDEKASNEIVGEMGIEKSYNTELSGEDGYTLYQKDRKGYKIPGTKEVTKASLDGKDIHLTIDSTIQLFVEQAINSMSKKYHCDWFTMMVADAKTGSILASSTYPSFDPNLRNIKNYVDYNIGYAFEPGSTMKTYSYMAALETGKYKGNQTYKSGVYVTKDGTEIGDWNRDGWGDITLDQGFALSSNTAVITLINKYIGGNKLKEYYKKLGFGSKTGIELAGEVSGKVDFKYETEVLNAGFGQGILTTTPIQNIKALTAISNNGVLLKPYIIDKIVDPNTNTIVYQGKKEELGVVASKKTVSKIKSLMKSVINGNSSNSTGYVYYMKGYDLIGKTGTAQVAKENGRGYTDSTIRGFTGMFPGDDPQIIMYVAAKNPDGGTPPMTMVIKEVVKNISNYIGTYDGGKNKNNTLENYIMPSYINKDVNVVKDELKKKKMDVVILGDGDKIIKQYPTSNSTVSKLDKVFLLTNGKNIKMPNVIGFSSREVTTLCNMLNIKYELDGEGYVTSQSIKEGTKLDSKSNLKVTLKPKFNEK